MGECFSFVIPAEKEGLRYTAKKDPRNNTYIVSFNFGSVKTSTTYTDETVRGKLKSNAWVKI